MPLNKSNIVTGNVVLASDVSQLINAFTHSSSVDLLVSGSLTIGTGSVQGTDQVYIKRNLNVAGGITGSVSGSATYATEAVFYDLRLSGAGIGKTSLQNTNILSTVLDNGKKSIYIPSGVMYDRESIADNKLDDVIIFDGNSGSFSYGTSTTIELPSGLGDSHITMRGFKNAKNAALYIMPKGKYPNTPYPGGQYSALKIGMDDIESTIAEGQLDYRDGGFYANDGGYNGTGVYRINSKNQGNFAGAWQPIEFTFLNNTYKAMTIANLQPQNFNVPVDHNGGLFYSMSGADLCYWYSGRPTTTGEIIVNEYSYYRATTTGTTGATRPVHTSSIQTDGGVSWSFLENMAPSNNNNLRYRPRVIFGDYGDDVPTHNYRKVIAEFAEDVLFQPLTNIVFSNSSFDHSGSLITRLNTSSPGLRFHADDDHYAVLSSLQFKPVGIPFVNSIASKIDGATTQDVSGSNVISFNDTSATNFTGFLNGIGGQEIIANFNTANTTLVDSVNFKLGGSNFKPIAGSSYKFYIGSSTVSTLVSDNPSVTIRNQSSAIQSASFSISGSSFISGSLSISGSAEIASFLLLKPSNPLPTGRLGMIAVSGSSGTAKPYFHNGSSWAAFF